MKEELEKIKEQLQNILWEAATLAQDAMRRLSMEMTDHAVWIQATIVRCMGVCAPSVADREEWLMLRWDILIPHIIWDKNASTANRAIEQGG